MLCASTHLDGEFIVQPIINVPPSSFEIVNPPAQLSAAAGFRFSGVAMARGRPKKPGERKPCGRLKQNQLPDAGSDMVTLRREEIVGKALAANPKAAWVFGRL